MHKDAKKIRNEKTGKYVCSKCGFDSYRIEYGRKICNDCDGNMVFKKDAEKGQNEYYTRRIFDFLYSFYDYRYTD